jgi:hypothetical protein
MNADILERFLFLARTVGSIPGGSRFLRFGLALARRFSA